MKSSKNIKTIVVKMTPKKAKKILARNYKNQRTLKPGNLNFITNEIKNGNWALNGENIIIATNGNLLDGQTRLQAIIKTNTAVETLVTTGIEEKTFGTIDTGRSRTNGDYFTIVGEDKAKVLASLCKFLYYWEKGVYSSLLKGEKVSSAVLDDILNKNLALRTIANNVDKKPVRSVCSPTIFGAMYYLMSLSDSTLAKDFFYKLETGLGLKKGEPVALLREKLMQDKGNKRGKLVDQHKVALVIKAWNATKERKRMKNIMWKDGTPFPNII